MVHATNMDAQCKAEMRRFTVQKNRIAGVTSLMLVGSCAPAHELNSVADSSKFHSVVLRHRECRAHCLGVTTLGAVTIQIVIASQPTGVGCVTASLPCRCSVQQLRLARDSSWCESRSSVCHQNVVIFRHGVRLPLSSCHVVAVLSCWFLQVLIVHTLSGLSIHL